MSSLPRGPTRVGGRCIDHILANRIAMAGVLGAADPGAAWPRDHHPLDLRLKRPPSVPMAKIKIPQPLPVIASSQPKKGVKAPAPVQWTFLEEEFQGHLEAARVDEAYSTWSCRWEAYLVRGLEDAGYEIPDKALGRDGLNIFKESFQWQA
eukprot:882783-Amphidinium_carterae.1